MNRMILGLAACAALMLSGCAAIAAGGAGELVEKAQAPAIVAIEGAVAAQFDRASDRLEQGAGEAEARELAQSAAIAASRLGVARLAYDATIGSSAPAGVQHVVAAARAATDAALERLARLLAARQLEPPS